MDFESKFLTWRANVVVPVTPHEGCSQPNRTGQHIFALQAGTSLLVTNTVRLHYWAESSGGR
jgi:hypothetical protein